MIASQFNLDQRLAELLEIGPASNQNPHAARQSASTAARLGAALRSLFAGTTASRPARIAAH